MIASLPVKGLHRLLPFFFLLATICSVAQQPYQLAADGVIVYPDPRLPGNVRAVKLQVITDQIIRVMASPAKEFSTQQSLSVVPQSGVPEWNARPEGDNILLTTSFITAKVDQHTGAVSFTGKDGHPILAERTIGGRSLTPAVFEGKSLYGVRQTFETTADDAFYGLGQHQEDAFNYKGKQVFLFQNNTEVAVPFVVSVKNYGILWDNYSLSTAGDTRPFLPLSSLALFDKKGVPGWLTASYSNDRNKPDEIAFEKAESVIDYPYVNDSKLKLPKEFAVEKGMITWEGAVASDRTGVHTLRFTSAGYLKVWVDGKLLLDKWRQAWNPGAAIVPLTLQAGKKQFIKIQWIPDGGESYLTCKWLGPAPVQDEHAFSFDSEAGKQLDYYFIHGRSMDEVIAGYRRLTGKAPIVPKWAMGFWQSRERYKTQDEILQTVKTFRTKKIPLDNIVLDWSYWKQNDWGSQEFDAARFSNPDSMIDVLHKQYHTRLMISVWPKFYEGIPAYNHFDKNGWLYKRNIADRQRDWIAQGYMSTFYDAFNADARKGFWNLIHDKLYVKGIDAWWMDASEPDILSNVSPERRKEQMSPTALGTAAEFLNAYPLQNAKGIYEGQRGVDPDKRVFLLTRSGFAGSQRYAASIWSGDIASRWEDMKAQISAGLNFSLSGLPYWTMDIGGFSVERRYEQPNAADLAEWRELMTRWYQFGAFVPLFRVHGQFPYREIFNTAPDDHPAYRSMLYYNRLRYRLLPYIYTLAGNAYHDDYTIMRGLVMDFAADTAVRNTGDQFMLGPSLLINPVYTYKATDRSVYLPAGQGWYDLYTGAYYNGGTAITATAPYERVPVFVKEGSILPAGPELQYTAEKPADPITLYVYAGRDAAFALYEDEDLNYNYEKGAFSRIHFRYDEASRTLTIDDREGTFPGMLKQRTFYIRVISKAAPGGIDFSGTQGKKIKYSGKKITVKL
ncbi:MAG: TIM-barrel domain-containing protein [Chitinophagaceae bacterium]